MRRGRAHRPAGAVLGLAFLLCSSGAAAGGLLAARDAFRLTGEWVGGEVVVRYRVAEGYYLYRDKLRFAAEPESVRLGRASVPRGTTHEDEFFGRSEVFRKEVVVRIPVEAPKNLQRFAVRVTSQGCADAGVCYTPVEERLQFGPGTGAGTTAGPGGRKDQLLESLGVDRP
jgi:thiol:disulfide interchange protein DsbD